MRSKVQKVKCLFMKEDGQVVNKEYVAFQAPIEDLATTVTLESRPTQLGYEELKKSVLTELLNPVIVIKNNEKEWENATNHISPEMVQPFDPSKKWLVLMGNQRLAMLIPEGIKDISAFEIDHWPESVLLTKKLTWMMENDKSGT